eukprot:jgi/Ulvmu1/2335/UM013_0183.1
MGIPHKAFFIAGLMMVAPAAVFADSDDSDSAPSGCSSAAGVADGNGATIFNDAVGDLLPSGSAAVDDVTADSELDEPVTVLVPTNSALDRNTTRALARSGNLQGVIETHVVFGEIDADSVEDGSTAQTVSGETIVFTRSDDGTVTASVEGGADSVTLGERQDSCAGPVYVVSAPLRPAAIAPFVVEMPAPAPEAPAPAPEAPAPVPEEMPAPAPVGPAPVPEAPAPAPIVEAPLPIVEPVEGPMEVPVEGPMVAPIVAPIVAPVVAPVEAPIVVTPAFAPIIQPLVPLGVAPRDFVLPLPPADAPGPAACATLADKLAQINPALLEAAALLPEEILAALNDPTANITILSPPEEDLGALVGPDVTQDIVVSILTAHIFPDPFFAADLEAEGDGAELETLNEDVTLELNLAEGVAFDYLNITATVIEADIDACAPNSVIHTIDTVIFPSGDPAGIRDLPSPIEEEDDDGAVSAATIVPALVAVVAGAWLLL